MAETSLIGGLAGLDKGNDDELLPVYYSKQYTNLLNSYSKLLNRKGLMEASDAYRAAFEANNPLAAKNAEYYAKAGREIFEDPNTYLGDYGSIRSGNLDALKSVYQNVLDYGLAGIKGRLAAGGYGNQGPSSYDRILNSQMTTSNIAPVLQTIFGNLGRDAGASYGSRMTNNQNKLALMANDFLTRYADNNAARTLTPYLTQTGLVNNNAGIASNIIDAIARNTAGYQLEKGLATRLNESAEGVQNFAKFFMSMYGMGAGGGMGGIGGMGGAGAQPASATPAMMPGGGGGGGVNAQQILQLIMQMMGRNNGTPISTGLPSGSIGVPANTGDLSSYFNQTALA